MSAVLEEVLRNIGLTAVYSLFKKERITDDMVSALTDADLARLGIETIGDRIRFREGMKLKSRTAVDQFDQTTHRNFLFRPTSANSSNSSKSNSATATLKNKHNGWTAQLFCLAHTDDVKAPTATQKEILINAGLGLKKVRFLYSDKENEICQKITSSVAFPKLKEAGGFELLRMLQNGREFKLIERPWTSKHLKNTVGPQARIYIRPIQQTLSLEPVVESDPEAENVQFECKECKKLFPIEQLRDHVKFCRSVAFTTEDTGNDNNDSYEIANIDILNNSTDPAGSNLNIREDDEGAAYFLNAFHDISHLESHSMGSANDSFSGVLNEHSITVSGTTLGETTLEHTDSNTSVTVSDSVLSSTDKISLSQTVEFCINYCVTNSVTNPVEILRKLQDNIVTGRDLDITDAAECLEGDTNYIIIDRSNLMQTAMSELNAIEEEELRKTLEVQFYNEMAQDYGGPRKEFFREILLEIKLVYFDKGLRELLKDDYKTVGLIFALSILQNGPFPAFLSDEIRNDLFSEQDSSPCISKLREGLDMLGIYQVCLHLPSFRFLFQKSNVVLSVKKLTSLLRPVFSEEGSNSCRQEKAIYSLFIKYIREVGRGCRGDNKIITLGDVLSFVSGCEEEPVLGFAVHPSIHFHEVAGTYLPTANTCVNILNMPRPSTLEQVPTEETLFKMYDYGFSNNYYGLK